MPSSTKPTKLPKRRGVEYLRVSARGDRDGDKLKSPGFQHDRIAGLAEGKNIKLVESHTDIDESGGTEDRPGFQAALAAVKEGRADVILVSRMSRFARNVLAAEKALKEIEEAGGQLICGDLDVDTSTSQGKLMRQILSAFAEFELEVHKEQWEEAKKAAHGNGVKLAGKAPIGYQWINGEDKRLVPDPTYKDLVPQVFALRAAQTSWTEVVKWWLAQTGETRDRSTFAAMVRNRVYVGEVVYRDWVKAGAHEALVSEEEWQAAQGVKAPRLSRRQGSLLAGVLVCGSCGGKLVSGSAGKGRGSRYRCQNYGTGECAAPASVSHDHADPYVEAAFLKWAAERVEVEGNAASAKKLEAALKALEAARGEYQDFSLQVSASEYPDLLEAGLKQRAGAIVEAEERVEEIRATETTERLRTSIVKDWRSGRLSLEDKRKLLHAADARVVVHPSGAFRSANWVEFKDRSEVSFRG
jgi:DNA invertase Pin-like site-specific DNA recombinase